MCLERVQTRMEEPKAKKDKDRRNELGVGAANKIGTPKKGAGGPPEDQPRTLCAAS